MAGCHEDLAVPGPAWDDQQAYLLAIDRGDGEVPEIWAFDVDPGLPVRGPSLSLQGTVDLFSVHFPCPLSLLGIPEGRLGLRTDRRPFVPLPRALGIQTLRIDDGNASTWSSTVAVPVEVKDALQALPVGTPVSNCTGRTPTVTLEPAADIPDDVGEATVVHPLRSGDFFVSTENEMHFIIDGTGNATPVTIDVEAQFLAAYEQPDGTIWLLSDDGRLVSGIVGGAWTVASSTVPFARPAREGGEIVDKARVEQAALVGPDVAGVPMELFAAGDDRTLAHYDPATDTMTDLSVVIRPRNSPNFYASLNSYQADLIWLGPGELIASDVADNRDQLVYVRNGDANVVREEQLENDGVSTIVTRSNGTIMMGTTAGQVLVFANPSWTPVARISRRQARPFSQYENSLLVGSVGRPPLNERIFQWFQVLDTDACAVGDPNLPIVEAIRQLDAQSYLLITKGELNNRDFTVRIMTLSPATGPTCTGGTIPL